ncbi:MAG: hypothetical protein ACRDUW_29220, partial [Pseudonocardiaceae bacterium]
NPAGSSVVQEYTPQYFARWTAPFSPPASLQPGDTATVTVTPEAIPLATNATQVGPVQAADQSWLDYLATPGSAPVAAAPVTAGVNLPGIGAVGVVPLVLGLGALVWLMLRK